MSSKIYGDEDEYEDGNNNWKKFTGNCGVALIFTLLWGIWGANLIFLAKIAARQGKSDCWGKKQDSDGNTLTLLDIYYPTDQEIVPYKGICPPVLVQDYEQFRLGEYYPCGENYDTPQLKLKNWWMLMMQSAGFRKVGRPYTWIDAEDKKNNVLTASVALAAMMSFIYNRGAFKTIMFFLTIWPDWLLMALSPLMMLYIAFIVPTIGFIGSLAGSKDVFKLKYSLWKKILLGLPLLIIALLIPFFFSVLNGISMFFTYILQPILTDAHLIFNIVRCNSKILALIFGFCVLLAANHSLKPEIVNTMSGVYVVILLMNCASVFS